MGKNVRNKEILSNFAGKFQWEKKNQETARQAHNQDNHVHYI